MSIICSKKFDNPWKRRIRREPVLVLHLNLGSIFSGALTGNTPAEFPGTSAKDSKEQLVELLLWLRIFRADLREEVLGISFRAKIIMNL